MTFTDEIKMRQKILFLLFTSSGLFSLIGLNIPFISIRLDQNVVLQLTGGNLYFTESLTLTFGTLMVFTGGFLGYNYLRKLDSIDIDKKLENVMVILALSFMSSFVGILFVMLDIFNAYTKASSIGLENPIALQIGFVLSVIGPIILIIGFIYLGTTRKKIHIHLNQKSLDS